MYDQEKHLVVRRQREDGEFLYYITNANTGSIEWGGIEEARMLSPRQAALIENICIEEFYVVEVIPFRESLRDV